MENITLSTFFSCWHSNDSRRYDKNWHLLYNILFKTKQNEMQLNEIHQIKTKTCVNKNNIVYQKKDSDFFLQFNTLFQNWGLFLHDSLFHSENFIFVSSDFFFENRFAVFPISFYKKKNDRFFCVFGSLSFSLAHFYSLLFSVCPKLIHSE